MKTPGLTLNRRTFLMLTSMSAGAGVAAAAGIAAAAATDGQGGGTPHIPSPAQSTGDGGTLHIPPLAQSTDGNRPVFDLVAQMGRSAIVPGGEADTWGFNGSLLGPTLRVRRGDDVQINFRNDLDETTTVHWHGMRLPAEADGGPHQMIDPGAEWSPSWTVDQPAATLWYHPHPHGATEAHVYRGLGGMFIIDDDEEASLDLPREYGVDDIPVIVQDKSFDESGQLVEPLHSGAGMLGDTILVNGTASATFEVAAEMTRLRLLNASTARSYSFGFADDREFDMIASDGGLLTEPARLTRITLTPAERAEVVVRMSPGESVALRSFPQDLGDISGNTGVEDDVDVLVLSAPDALRPSPALPAQLARIDPLDQTQAVITREFAIRTDRINDEQADMGRVDEVVTVDTVEIWDVVNVTSAPHNFHVHGVQFQVVEVNGQIPGPELAGWKDTVYAPPDIPIRLIMRFADHTDPATAYMYHCHLLWHEDGGIMGQFVVVEPGQDPEPLSNSHDH